MSGWEYKTALLVDLAPRVLEVDVLNELGREGWELVWITLAGLAYFKRPILAPARSGIRRA